MRRQLKLNGFLNSALLNRKRESSLKFHKSMKMIMNTLKMSRRELIHWSVKSLKHSDLRSNSSKSSVTESLLKFTKRLNLSLTSTSVLMNQRSNVTLRYITLRPPVTTTDTPQLLFLMNMCILAIGLILRILPKINLLRSMHIIVI